MKATDITKETDIGRAKKDLYEAIVAHAGDPDKLQDLIRVGVAIDGQVYHRMLVQLEVMETHWDYLQYRLKAITAPSADPPGG